MSPDAPQARISQAEVEQDEAAVAAVEAEAGPLPPDRFLDREISWLAFNERVLQLAEDPHLPVLERAKFLAIFASNLDEFFMVRVAGLKRRIATGIAVRAPLAFPCRTWRPKCVTPKPEKPSLTVRFVYWRVVARRC